MSVRQIIEIDEELCTGCGLCVPACAEGAIRIIDGKARLVADGLCDGLGACLGECPEGALKITERPAADFDEQAVRARQGRARTGPASHDLGGCPSARLVQFDSPRPAPGPLPAAGPSLGHWPVKLKLVPPQAPFLRDRDLVLAADCVGFAFARAHRELLEGRALVIGCPKFDDFEADLERLSAILAQGQVRSLTVAHMEVPCCHGYVHLARQAAARSGRDIPLGRIEVAIDGRIKSPAQQSLVG